MSKHDEDCHNHTQVQKESEVIADEDQLFLMKLQTHLTKQPADTGAQRVSEVMVAL